MKTVALYAEMTGSVAQFHIEDGQRVEKDETVVDVECMKSYYPLHAPVSGTVRYRVALGDLVNPDDLVAVIETEEG
jgi:biotin carboxyl carrier protein